MVMMHALVSLVMSSQEDVTRVSIQRLPIMKTLPESQVDQNDRPLYHFFSPLLT